MAIATATKRNIDINLKLTEDEARILAALIYSTINWMGSDDIVQDTCSEVYRSLCEVLEDDSPEYQFTFEFDQEEELFSVTVNE